MFDARSRRWGLAYVAIATVAVGSAGMFVRNGERDFLSVWVLAAWPFLIPALIASAKAARRSPAAHRLFWRLWFAGLMLYSSCTLAIAANANVDIIVFRPVAGLLAIAAIAVWCTAVFVLLRSKSGLRMVWVDIADWAIVLVVFVAPVLLLIVEPLSQSPAAWFAVPCAAFASLLTATVVSSAVLLARLPPKERVAEVILVGLVVVSTVNAWALVAESLSGFTLAAVPLLAVQALDMGMLLILPLFSHRLAPVGLDRLPVHAQVRRRSAMPVLVVSAVPIFVAETIVVRDGRSWAVPFSVMVLGTLILLAALKHLLTIRETRLLYLELERFATVLDAADDPIAIARPDGQVLYLNAPARRLLPAGKDDQESVSLEDLFDPLAGDRAGDASVVEVPREPTSGDDQTMSLSVVAHSDEYGQVEFLSAISHDVTRLKRVETLLRAQATTDPLTGLSNRVVVFDRLDTALARSDRQAGGVAVLFVDLDHFKRVNDEFGHAAGDQLLIEVARRLRSAVRAGDTVGRIGGDEFLVLVEPIESVDDATAVGNQILDALRAPFGFDWGTAAVSASVGVATSAAFATAHSLVNAADSAAYVAKAEGRSRVAVAKVPALASTRSSRP